MNGKKSRVVVNNTITMSLYKFIYLIWTIHQSKTGLYFLVCISLFDKQRYPVLSYNLFGTSCWGNSEITCGFKGFYPIGHPLVWFPQFIIVSKHSSKYFIKAFLSLQSNYSAFLECAGKNLKDKYKDALLETHLMICNC